MGRPWWNTRVIATSHSVPMKWVLRVFLAKQSETQWVGDSTIVPNPVCDACWLGLRVRPGPEFSRGKPQRALKTQHNSWKTKSNWSKATYVYAQTKRPSSCSKTRDFIERGRDMQRNMLFKRKVVKPVIIKMFLIWNCVISIWLIWGVDVDNYMYLLLIAAFTQQTVLSMMWDDCYPWW